MSEFLIWIDRLISVALMSLCTSARTMMAELGCRQLFSTVDHSDIRGLGAARRHIAELSLSWNAGHRPQRDVSQSINESPPSGLSAS